MTKLSKQTKIDSWENVKETINEISENIPDHTNALSLPYGLQNLYTISHQEPVRILLHPNMNDYDTFVTHHGKAKKFYLNVWTVNHKDCPEKEKIKLQQNMQLRYQIKKHYLRPNTSLFCRVCYRFNPPCLCYHQFHRNVLCADKPQCPFPVL